MGSGFRRLGRYDSTSRETQHVSVCGADGHRSDLVQIFAGHYPKELEPFRRQLLPRRGGKQSAVQDLEVRAGTEGEGERGRAALRGLAGAASRHKGRLSATSPSSHVVPITPRHPSTTSSLLALLETHASP